MMKTFYAIVAESDCTAEQAKNYGMERNGPILFECYLNEHAQNEEAARERSKQFSQYGWVRVAQVTVHIPEYCCDKGKLAGLIDRACADCLANFGDMTP